ncbi:hypothetical protein CC85DRAFT_325137 [Cutaneotrichosporon oleaginosum]|uniref:Zinc finger protein 830 n=1 Tax=Cutaneotrichosporon oleaginosum TaxID=879819 RepID=A0A0J0XXS0_9TREE|nr:uncharacterized protein CC85DRAFT_325137 [Cutaneotrichosporon oleaginosum]KLT45856.1 hypothetical protein CC85DRAFT_325137 [Cutaneotrichosporon oleaginosum]TXT06559.1 hypothetical protein COLE_05890 [Cutaneotrichosporon oleaginosum]
MDAKSLLRAKKAAARIEHPHATYSAAGQLRCSICAVPVKQWDAHLLTKAHRQSVAREKKEAAAREKKRAAPAEEEGSSKRARIEEAPSKLPPGFFEAGHEPQVEEEDTEGARRGDDKEEEGKNEEEKETGREGEKGPDADAELDAFLASLNDEPEPTALEPTKKRRTYKEQEEDGVASYSAAPQLVKDGEEREPTPEPEETEAERRARIAREEREEVLARLEEEQRAQEDADARVDALKARMEALKKKREARGATGGKGGAAAKALAKAASKKK